MLRRIWKQYADNVDILFPYNCLDIVSNQIKEYWKRRRRDILKGEDPDKFLFGIYLISEGSIMTIY
jgi:hypothetical protein